MADLTRRIALALLAVSCALGVCAGSAVAAPAELWSACDESAPEGQRCSNPRGIGVDRENGHVFVGDQAYNRVVELNAVGQFIKTWGWDVVEAGPGDDTAPPEDEFEICVPNQGDECKAGLGGFGTGQFSNPVGIAVDSEGAVYAVDFSNRRVEKFLPTGQFDLMFGGEVNKTKVEEGTASATEENICPFDPGDQCQNGTTGSGPGQFGAWQVGSFIAIDGADNVYVGDEARIQAFDTGGSYVDECNTGDIPSLGTVTALATDSAGDLYAKYTGTRDVRKLTAPPSCELLAEPVFELPQPPFTTNSASAIAVAPGGEVFAFGATDCCGNQDNLDPIVQFDRDGNVIDEFGKGEFNPLSNGLAANLCPGSPAPGNFYVSNLSSADGFVRAYGTDPVGCFKAHTGEASEITEFAATLNGTVDPGGAAVSECRFEYGETTAYGQGAPCAEYKSGEEWKPLLSPAELGEGSEPVPVRAPIAGLQKGTVYHFRLLAKVGGEAETGFDSTFKTLGPPVISEDHVASASATQATLEALVNPEGFPTTYRFEYGLTDEYGSLTSTFAAGSDRADHPAQAVLGGLAPQTTYHWRIVAVNSSGPAEGPDRTLTTYPVFSSPPGCPNEGLRAGTSATLPDCRAYEMVSPVDKNGGDIVTALDFGDPGGFIQAASDGDAITYTSLTSFAGQPTSFRYNQYLARRGPQGWTTEGIHPPANGKSLDPQPGNYREFMAFTPDLCSAWLIDYQDPPLVEGAAQDYPNLLRRDNCAPGAGSLEALTVPESPPLSGSTSQNYVVEKSVQATTPDGAHALFTARTQLTPEAAPCCTQQLYDRFAGKVRLVSVLPGGAPASGVPGSGDVVTGGGWDGNLEGALSEDGERAYWSFEGDIYLREHPGQGRVAGECDGAGLNACTQTVSEGGIAFGGALFWAASPDGAKALFSQQREVSNKSNNELRIYDAESDSSQPIAADVRGVAGQSDDLQRVYFISNAALPGAGANSPWGEEAIIGKPNLYLWEAGEGGGEVSFVATLLEGDLGEREQDATFEAYDLAAENTYFRATRASAEGAALAFNSRAPLTDYDNTAADGRPAVEVYRYDAGTDELTCVSCNPAGARPRTEELHEPYVKRSIEAHPTKVTAAAWIPTWEHPTHASNVLSEDGERLFFNANDALVPRDANGAPDVYQWEAAGTGGCSASSPSYFPQRRGCIDLISSGQSPQKAEFWEASADGSDVFFTTARSLVSADPGLIDLYDARVGGGYPEPDPKSECEGEACQSPPPPPRFDEPASGAYAGPGNVRPSPCAAPAKRAAKLSRVAARSRRSARRALRAGEEERAGKLREKAKRAARRARQMSAQAKRCRRRAAR